MFISRRGLTKKSFFRMWEQLKRRSSYQALPTIEPKKQSDLFRDLHHPVFQSIRVIQVRKTQVFKKKKIKPKFNVKK